MAAPLDVLPTTDALPAIEVAEVAPAATPDGAWAPATQPVSRALGTDAVWFRVVLRNPEAAPERAWVEVDSATLDRVSLTVDGAPAGDAGLLVPRAAWPARSPLPLFPVDLPPGATVTVVGRVASENERLFSVGVLGDDALTPHLVSRGLRHGAFLGGMGLAGLLGLALAARLRDRVYAAYGAYTLAIATWIAALDGELFHALPWLAAAPRLAFALPGFVGSIGGALFALWFVGDADPRLARLLRALIAFEAGAIVLSNATLPWWRVNQVTLPLVLVSMSVLTLSTLVVWRRGVRGAQWIAFGWLGLFATMAIGIPVATMGLDLPFRVRGFDLFRVGYGLDVLGFSMALGVRMQEALVQRDTAAANERAARRLGRYFPKALVERVLASEEAAVVGSERVLVTVLFSDLRGFTDLSDRTSPERITSLLNEFLGAVVPIVERHGGAVDKMMGDGLMVLFGTPEARPSDAQARAAVDAAVEMHAALRRLGDKWRSEGLDHDVQMRVGIHQDYVTVGNFGTAELMTRTAIGGGVNLAARLENGCTPGRILASFPVVAQVPGRAWGPYEERTFKGIVRPQKVAELDPAG